MTLEEKNLEYSIVEEDLAAPSAELLKLHPEGKVPLLIHNGTPLYESSIITEYLDEEFPRPPLRPVAPLKRAQLRLMTYECDEFFKPDIDLFKYEYETLSEIEQNSLLARLRGHLGKMAEPLKLQSYLMGSELTLADIHVFPFFRQLQKTRADFSKFFHFPELDTWLQRITQRPSFEKVMRKNIGK